MSKPNPSSTSEEKEIEGFCGQCREHATLSNYNGTLLSDCCGAVSWSYDDNPEG